jgi:hypothetical protein
MSGSEGGGERGGTGWLVALEAALKRGGEEEEGMDDLSWESRGGILHSK